MLVLHTLEYVVMEHIYIGIEISSSFILIEIVHWMDRQATPCHATHTRLPLSNTGDHHQSPLVDIDTE